MIILHLLCFFYDWSPVPWWLLLYSNVMSGPLNGIVVSVMFTYAIHPYHHEDPGLNSQLWGVFDTTLHVCGKFISYLWKVYGVLEKLWLCPLSAKQARKARHRPTSLPMKLEQINDIFSDSIHILYMYERVNYQ